MKVSVVVANYNGGILVNECLESVFRQDAPFEYEVIVVDNASTDGSREAIKSRFPNARLIANEVNTGFSRANNQAIRMSSSPYILLLNNDAYLKEKDFLKNACSFMDKRGDAAALGPEILSPEGRVQNPYYMSYPNIATEFLSLSGFLPLYNLCKRDKYFFTREGLAYHRKGVDIRAVYHLCGACMFLRRKAIEDIGLFDERMFFYREDLDLCYRLRKKGWKIFVLQYITAVHAGTGSSKKASFSVMGEATKSMYIFFKKNYGNKSYLCLRIIYFAAGFFRILFYPYFRMLGKSSPKAWFFYRELLKYSLIGIK